MKALLHECYLLRLWWRKKNSETFDNGLQLLCSLMPRLRLLIFAFKVWFPGGGQKIVQIICNSFCKLQGDWFQDTRVKVCFIWYVDWNGGKVTQSPLICCFFDSTSVKFSTYASCALLSDFHNTMNAIKSFLIQGAFIFSSENRKDSRVWSRKFHHRVLKDTPGWNEKTVIR